MLLVADAKRELHLSAAGPLTSSSQDDSGMMAGEKGPILLARERHPAERFGDALFNVVHAPLPGVRFGVIYEVIREGDLTFVIFEHEWKFTRLRGGCANGLRRE